MTLPKLAVHIANVEALAIHQVPIQTLRRSLFLGAQWVQALWIMRAQALDIRGSGAYIRGLQSESSIRMEEPQQGRSRLSMTVSVVATAPHSRIIEEGHAAFHLPSKINWGATGGRIKRTKKGTPYLHIPFRHRAFATPEQADKQGLTTATRRQMMPKEVYELAKRLHYTQKRNMGPIYDYKAAIGRFAFSATETSAAHAAGLHKSMGVYLDAAGRRAELQGGVFRQADFYKYPKDLKRRRLDRSHIEPVIIGGDAKAGIEAGGPGWPGGVEERRSTRIVGRDAKGNPMINPTWTTSKWDGLFKAGSKGHTRYMTVRTLTPDSKGWNIPAQAGFHLAAAISREASTNEELREIMLGPILAALGIRR